MKVASWNVNSVRAREARLLAWLARTQPELVCLQELKAENDVFPSAAVEALGYQAAVHGQRTYNGVAILSRAPLTEIERGFGDGEDDAQARVIRARVAGIRVFCAYFPNGGEVGSEKFAYKLRWMERMRRYLERTLEKSESAVLCGDFNVAPEDRDVARPEEWKDSVLCHPEARAALARIADLGLVDTFRRQHSEGGHYSWWDYRMLGFPKNNGLRIDHIFATEPLAARCQSAEIDRNERKGKQPSDHAPVLATFSQ
ncbi:MAG TPA: exodeoxyribonuclease III [Deltaproteobacteria bacterium]|jgi:exodeoxyribonuclease-3|nr:exodeoxyribonuclease III [Deltaproteobacteria bacterium]